MTPLVSFAVFLAMVAACMRLSQNQRDPVGYAIVVIALLSLILVQNPAVAVFSGLALLSVSGLLVAMYQGIVKNQSQPDLD